MTDDDLATAVANLAKLAGGYDLFADIEDDAIRRAYMWGCAWGYRDAAAKITRAGESHK